jgi:uncharacterized coiled-coil protein SlyX
VNHLDAWWNLICVGKWAGLKEDYRKLDRGYGGLVAARISDAARTAYDKLSAQFDELTGELADLWAEVQYLREFKKLANAQMDKNRDKIVELERYKERTQGLCMTMSGYSFTSWDKVQCRAVPEHVLANTTNRITELNKQLAVRDAAIESLRQETGKQRHELHNLKLSSDAEIRRLVKSNQSLAHPLPITYGVDVSKETGEVTVITVKQGGKPLFCIDVEQENAKRRIVHDWKWKPYTLAQRFIRPLQNLPRSGGYAAELRVSADIAERNKTIVRLNRWQSGRGLLYNHNKRWTRFHDEDLTTLYKRGDSVASLAVVLKREWEAVLYRLACNAKWPEEWVRHDKFLPFALMWFFKPSGVGLDTHMRLERFTRLPKGGLFQ